MTDVPVYLTSAEVAKILRHADTQTLRRWRREGGGPPYLQPRENGDVLYPREAFDVWRAANTTA